jgi:hypothetical protein
MGADGVPNNLSVKGYEYDIHEYWFVSHMLHGAGIFTNICLKNRPNVGKYTIHGAYG